MDLMTKLGGRKFIMAQIAAGVGTYVEFTHGLSPTFAGFLVALVGAFSAVNYMATAKHFDSKAQNGPDGDAVDKINAIYDMAVRANEAQGIQALTQVLGNLDNKMGQVLSTTGQIGSAVIGLNKEVGAVKRAVSQPTF